MGSVSIIGLGWLGMPLALHLRKLGVAVKGSTTSREKASLIAGDGIESAVMRLAPHPEGEGFRRLFETEILFINIPPKSRINSDTFYLEQNKFLKEMAKQAGVGKVIFVSSTSVYPEAGIEYSEEFTLSRETSGSPGIWEAENLWFHDKELQCSVIRYGGLLGVDRIPGRYFSGKEQVVGDTPVNFIHRDDAVRLAAWVMEKGLWGEIINGVAPMHPMRRDIYEKNARELGFPPPKSYATARDSASKVISSEKILKKGFRFQFPNPLDFSYLV